MNEIEIINQNGYETELCIGTKDRVRITFYSDKIVRIVLAADGGFDDPTNGEILAIQDAEKPQVIASWADDYYKLQTACFVLRIYKSPARFAMYDKDDNVAVWEEECPIHTDGQSAIQILRVQDKEYFYGGGMQNGYFSHKGRKIAIEKKIKHWNDGSVSNPAPFFMSTAGYGVFRNTYSPGEYEFTESVRIYHSDPRFDCFYFYGPSLPEILEGYTRITGRPTLIPRWGFGLGDADCYNTSNQTYTGQHDKPGKKRTPDVLEVLRKYRENDMPGAWVLPNDGYGCGYEELENVVKEAWQRYGFRTGLWTENGVDKIAHEVSVAGTRLCKLDVAWVGPGYGFALNASKTASNGIEDNTHQTDSFGTYSERSYVWSCCGWAGTQRYSAVWSGDQSGSWEYIRFHIPTYIGAGLSGISFAGSDIDGIFGGSAKTYTRDLQWKAFTPVMIAMSGWADMDKQPWVHGEPYASINRKYLKLRQRLMPYIYTCAAESYESALPIVRAMVLEFPDDQYVKDKLTQYQFMCGPSLLVAPVYTDTDSRDGIYLPEGVWIDYFTGKRYSGGLVLNNFDAPLDKLPLFVRNGAVIPMQAETLFDGQEIPLDKDYLTLDIYPHGKTSFELYEDDGHTTRHREGVYAKSLIISEEEDNKAFVTIKPIEGTYAGIPFARKYEILIHTCMNPETVTVCYGEAELLYPELQPEEDRETVRCCSWYFDKDDRGGVVRIRTKAIPLHEEVTVALTAFSAVEQEEIDIEVPLPGAPAGLSAAEVSDSSITLKWDVQNSADYYEVITGGLVYSNLRDTFTHTGLDFLTSYTYRVRAVNKTGAGEFSDEITASTQDDKMKRAVPFSEMYAYATSEMSPRFAAAKFVDSEKATYWVSDYQKEKLPQMITADFKKAYQIDKLVLTPRFMGAKAVITKYNLYLSEDGRRFERFIENGVWKDDGEDKDIEIGGRIVKSVRIEALETSKPEHPGAGAALLTVFTVRDSAGILPADYTGDGKVDMDDLNFVLQYYGSAHTDNSWTYVSKADIDGDGRIGVYDTAYAASLIEPVARPVYENKAAGRIEVKTDKKNAAVGEEFTMEVTGEGVCDMYAFECVINTGKYEVVSVRFNNDFFEHTASVTKDGILYAAGTKKANEPGVEGDMALASVTLKTLQGTDAININDVNWTIIGTNLDMVTNAGGKNGL